MREPLHLNKFCGGLKYHTCRTSMEILNLKILSHYFLNDTPIRFQLIILTLLLLSRINQLMNHFINIQPEGVWQWYQLTFLCVHMSVSPPVNPSLFFLYFNRTHFLCDMIKSCEWQCSNPYQWQQISQASSIQYSYPKLVKIMERIHTTLVETSYFRDEFLTF